MREPSQCAPAPADVAENLGDEGIRRRAGQLMWRNAFSMNARSSEMSPASSGWAEPAPRVRKKAGRYDWTGVYAAAKARRSAAAGPSQAVEKGEPDKPKAQPASAVAGLQDARRPSVLLPARALRVAGVDEAGAPIVVADALSTTVAPLTVTKGPLRGAEEGPLALTPELRRRLGKANDTVNGAIVHRTDAELYGLGDFWATPLKAAKSGYGDCEDYVLEKRRALLADGLPETALSIALVVTPWGESHAVLLVATDKGELVLDNLTPWIMFWNETRYRWVQREVKGRAFDWATVAEGPARTIQVASAGT